MKRIKTTVQCSLVSERLENLVRLGEEGVEWCGICKNKKTQSVQGNKNNIPNSSSSDESEFEGFGEKDFDKESDILFNKKNNRLNAHFFGKAKASIYMQICLL